MATKTLDINTLSVASPATPPTGYTRPAAASTADIVLTTVKEFKMTSGGTQALWYDNTVMTGALRKAEVVIGTTNGTAVGCGIADSSGNGYFYYSSDGNSNSRLYKLAAWVLGAQIGGNITSTHAAGQTRAMTWETSGDIKLYLNGSQIGTTFNDATTTNPTFACMISRGANLRSLTSEYTPSQVITSINGGNPITVGQAGVVINHTGFSGAATAVTTNRAGVTCTITAGDANSTTVTVSGWTEASPYPVVDNTVTFTVSRSGESASASQTLTKPANYAQVAFSGAITDDPNLIGYHLNAAGHAVDGGTFYYRTNQVSDLTISADTSWTSAVEGGTFNATFIPLTGATAGNAYLFDITVVNGSIVNVTGGLTSVGLTSIGLTSTGLTSVGL